MAHELPFPSLDDNDDPPDHVHQITYGKLDIAALLEEHLMPGEDPMDDAAHLDHIFEQARAQSEAGIRAAPVRDPNSDRLLACLHGWEARRPRLFAATGTALLAMAALLHCATLALNAAAVWVLWTHRRGTAQARVGLALLLMHLPGTALLLAMVLRGHHRLSAWTAVPLYDLGMMLALPVLRRMDLPERKRLARLRPWLRLSDTELWLWQYRAARQLVMAALHSGPMAILGVIACARARSTGMVGTDMGLLVAAVAVSALHAAAAGCEAALAARWSGQMGLVAYVRLALQLRGSRQLPYEWQSQLADRRLVIKPDAPEFFRLSRPQQCQLLRLALMRPHFAISNAVTHPRPPPKGAAAAAQAAAAGAEASGAAGGGAWGACGSARGVWGRCAAAAGRARAAGGRVPGLRLLCGSGTMPGGRRRRKGGSGSEDEEGGGRPVAPPSACLLLQSKAAVKTAAVLLPGPLAAARYTLGQGDFSVNLTSFTDAASCKYCRVLLELVMRQGLRSLVICDAKLPLDFLGGLTGHLPSRTCALTRLVLKDVMSSGISTLCMLCDAMAANASVAHLDLSNNQLWGLRGARELRAMLRRTGALRTIALPFCNIASLGAIEILKGCAECPTLESLDLSQNHIGDDLPDWGDTDRVNTGMREIDLSFNWIQDNLAGWAASLLEAFPTLARVHLNHNSDAASSRVASRAMTPRLMTPRTLTPRTLTLSNLRIASYSHQASAAPAAALGPGAPAATAAPAVGTGTLTFVASGGAPFAQGGPSSALSPSVSEKLERLPWAHGASAAASAAAAAAAGGGAGPLSAPYGAAGSSCGVLQPANHSINSAHEWQGHLNHAAAELPGRSRGQHLIAHLELHTLPPRTQPPHSPPAQPHTQHTSAALSGAPATTPASPKGDRDHDRASRRVTCASSGLGRNSGAPTRGSGRPPGSLWAAVAAMERLDLRGVPLPAWWARSAAHRPASVLVDEAQVYEEQLPPAAATAGAGTGLWSFGEGNTCAVLGPGAGAGGAGGCGGAGGGGGGGGLELPAHISRVLECGVAQGLVVIDLNSPEYKSLSRCQQLVAIYAAFAHATHITISNSMRGSGAGPGGAGLSAMPSGAFAAAGLTILRSCTGLSSFAQANHSGAAALYSGNSVGGVCGRAASEMGAAPLMSPRGGLCALGHTHTGPGMVRASGRAAPLPPVRLMSAVSARYGSSGGGGVQCASAAAADAAGVGGGRGSAPRRGHCEGQASNLHRFALQRSSSLTVARCQSAGAGHVPAAAATGVAATGAPFLAPAAAYHMAAAADGAAGFGRPPLTTSSSLRPFVQSCSPPSPLRRATVAATAADTCSTAAAGSRNSQPRLQPPPPAILPRRGAAMHDGRGPPAGTAGSGGGGGGGGGGASASGRVGGVGVSASGAFSAPLATLSLTPLAAIPSEADDLYVVGGATPGGSLGDESPPDVSGLEASDAQGEEEEGEVSQGPVSKELAALASSGRLPAGLLGIGHAGAAAPGYLQARRMEGGAGSAAEAGVLQGSVAALCDTYSGAAVAVGTGATDSALSRMTAQGRTDMGYDSDRDGGGTTALSGATAQSGATATLLSSCPSPSSLLTAPGAACTLPAMPALMGAYGPAAASGGRVPLAACISSSGDMSLGDRSASGGGVSRLRRAAAAAVHKRSPPTASSPLESDMGSEMFEAGIAALRGGEGGSGVARRASRLESAFGVSARAPAGVARSEPGGLGGARTGPAAASGGAAAEASDGSSLGALSPAVGTPREGGAAPSFSFAPYRRSSTDVTRQRQGGPRQYLRPPLPLPRARGGRKGPSALLRPAATAPAGASLPQQAPAMAMAGVGGGGLGGREVQGRGSSDGDGDDGEAGIDISFRADPVVVAVPAAPAGTAGHQTGREASRLALLAPAKAAAGFEPRIRSENGNMMSLARPRDGCRPPPRSPEWSPSSDAPSPFVAAGATACDAGGGGGGGASWRTLSAACPACGPRAPGRHGPTSAPGMARLPAYTTPTAAALYGVGMLPAPDSRRRRASLSTHYERDGEAGSSAQQSAEHEQPPPARSPLPRAGRPQPQHPHARTDSPPQPPSAAPGPPSVGHHALSYLLLRARSAFTAGPASDLTDRVRREAEGEAEAELMPMTGHAAAAGPVSGASAAMPPSATEGVPYSGATVRGVAAGVEASNAVTVVVVAGQEGCLRLPLRALELPLRGAMARRPGTTVAFRVAGLSHDGMRQLRALMAVAKVPLPERSHAWLLPSSTAHGFLPSGPNALPAPSVSGPGAAGMAGSRAMSRLDSMGAGTATGTGMGMYAHLPSYYMDGRHGQPIELGYILPPLDSAEPSEYLAMVAGGGGEGRGVSEGSNVVTTLQQEASAAEDPQPQLQLQSPPRTRLRLPGQLATPSLSPLGSAGGASDAAGSAAPSAALQQQPAAASDPAAALSPFFTALPPSLAQPARPSQPGSLPPGVMLVAMQSASGRSASGALAAGPGPAPAPGPAALDSAPGLGTDCAGTPTASTTPPPHFTYVPRPSLLLETDADADVEADGESYTGTLERSSQAGCMAPCRAAPRPGCSAGAAPSAAVGCGAFGSGLSGFGSSVGVTAGALGVLAGLGAAPSASMGSGAGGMAQLRSLAQALGSADRSGSRPFYGAFGSVLDVVAGSTGSNASSYNGHAGQPGAVAGGGASSTAAAAAGLASGTGSGTGVESFGGSSTPSDRCRAGRLAASPFIAHSAAQPDSPGSLSGSGTQRAAQEALDGGAPHSHGSSPPPGLHGALALLCRLNSAARESQREREREVERMARIPESRPLPPLLRLLESLPAGGGGEGRGRHDAHAIGSAALAAAVAAEAAEAEAEVEAEVEAAGSEHVGGAWAHPATVASAVHGSD